MIYKNNDEMNEIINFMIKKKNYWEDSVFEYNPKFEITQDLSWFRVFKLSLYNSSIKINYSFKDIREARFINEYLKKQMKLEDILKYDLDIAYFIAALKTNDVQQRIILLKKSINCRNGQVLVPEAFMELIKIFSYEYFQNKNSKNLIKILKCMPFINLIVTTNEDEELIEEIIMTLHDCENPSIDLITDTKVISYINILVKIGVKEFMFLLDDNETIKSGIDMTDFDYPEKFVKVTLGNAKKENINIPYINVFKD